MREMKDSGVAWIGEIPKEWKILPNKYLMKKEKSICESYNGEDILSLSMKGVVVRDLNSGGKMPLSFDGYQYLKPGNLLMCLFDIDVTPRCIGLIRNNGLSSPAYSQFSLSNFAFNEYYYYYYLMLDNSKTLYHLAKNLRHSLTEEQLGMISTAVPPLSIQHQIAAYLDQKCTQIDALITNQQKQIERLKAYKQSLITETVTKGLNPDVPMKDSGVEWIGEIPEDWEIVRIKNICQFNPSSKKSFSDDDIVSYVPMECVRTGSLVHKEIAIKNVSSGLTYFEENDIIMAKVTPCFENGNIAIATGLTKGMAFGSSELFVFRANESIKFFLFYFLQNNIFKKFSISTMTGTGGLKRVSPNFVNNYSFALPPIEERNKIVFYLDKKCTQIDSLIAIKQRKIEKLQQYKKSLIYEYVTGKKEI